MSSFIIEGGNRLKGSITPQGAKNEALQVICATLLTRSEVIIENIPDILDVNNLIELLEDMGVVVVKLGEGTYSFRAEEIDLSYTLSDEFMHKSAAMRGSIMIVGPLLARFGEAVVPKPRSEEHTSELQSRPHLVCRLLLEKKKKKTNVNSCTI